MRFQVGSTPQPSGDTMPRPVTTTRLMSSTPSRIRRPMTRGRRTASHGPSGKHSSGPPRASALCVLFQKFRRVAHGQNRFRGIVGDLAAELFFESHHELDRIEAVSAQVVNEARVVDHFFGLNTKVFDHDLLNPLANLTHRSTSCLFPLDPSPRRYEPSWSVYSLAIAHSLDLAPSYPTKARRTTAGSAPPIYRVSKSRKAFFAHPLVVRLSYFPSLDYKPQWAVGNRLSARRGVSNRLKSWPFHH